jgi:hypothetical protein
MKDSDEPAIAARADLEDVKRIISRNLPENMGLLDLMLIDAWLSQEMQSCLDKSKRFDDLEKFRIELDKRIKDHKDPSG